MSKYLLLAILFFACSSTQPIVVTPPPTPQPVPDTVTKTVYIHDTTTVKVHDTLTRTLVQQVASGIITSQTDSNSVYLTPSGGDDQPAIQTLVYARKHIRLAPGLFKFYHPVLVYTWNVTDYGQSWCWITGCAPAQNTAGPVTIIEMEDPRYPAFIVQRGKNFIFENLQGQGLYQPPQTQLAINTYTRAQWETYTSDAATHPHAFLVVDGFTDPADLGNDTTKMYPGYVNYYITGMSKSGSTGGQVLNCNIEGWNVGIVFTLGGTQNADCNTIDHCYFGNDMSAVESTQAQAKTNWVRDCMVWGGVHTIIDGVHYGLPHGDASAVPWVDGMNIAGGNYQFVESDSRSMPEYFKNVYAENLPVIGTTGAQTSPGAGVTFETCQFDLLACGQPMVYHGAGTDFSHCLVRYYGSPFMRAVLNDAGDYITGGTFGAPPIRVLGEANADLQFTPTGINIYSPAAGQSWQDSITGGGLALLRVGPGTAYYLANDTSGLRPGVTLLTAQLEPIDSLSLYHPYTQVMNYQAFLAIVDHVSPPDTVWLNNMGNFRDSTVMSVYKCLYRQK